MEKLRDAGCTMLQNLTGKKSDNISAYFVIAILWFVYFFPLFLNTVYGIQKLPAYGHRKKIFFLSVCVFM